MDETIDKKIVSFFYIILWIRIHKILIIYIYIKRLYDSKIKG